ncbi:MAG: hypothetical protein R3C25_13915 [Hyphomonadaceae bacterium]
MTLAWLPASGASRQAGGVLFEGGDAPANAQVDYRLHLERFVQETDQLMALVET